jgi:dihydrofolate reductase
VSIPSGFPYFVARLIYSTLSSLDHFVADAAGKWEFAVPDAEVHAFVNDMERTVGTYLYGRRIYEVMAVWETLEDPAPEMRDYASLWRAADKVVYSRTLRKVSTSRTRLEPRFEPEAVRALKASAARDLGIGGPTLAAEAIRAGLVDEWQFVLSPALVGGGKPSLPAGVRVELELTDTRTFGNGAVFLRYRTRP